MTEKTTLYSIHQHFIDTVRYRHDPREIPLDVPSRICITKDNTQLQVDGILYCQVTDPKLASYGSSNFELAITQLAQTTLPSVIGRMELDKTFEERDHIRPLLRRSMKPRGPGASRSCYRTLRSDDGRLAARVVRMTSTEQET